MEGSKELPLSHVQMCNGQMVDLLHYCSWSHATGISCAQINEILSEIQGKMFIASPDIEKIEDMHSPMNFANLSKNDIRIYSEMDSPIVKMVLTFWKIDFPSV